VGNIKVIEWISEDGVAIEGLLMTPANYDASKRYPLLVAVHGGPADNWSKRYVGGAWSYINMIVPISWNSLLDMGFVVFQPNPRGSSGYGRAFRFLNFGDLGGGDYQDIMSGIDHLIEIGVADPDHLAIYGWSYGGYLTAWAVTQTTRFKAAVAGAALTDLISFACTTDVTFYLPEYLGSTLWNQNKMYLERSPILQSKQVKTPLFLIHGQKDARVPLSQSLEFHTLLKAQKKPVKMFIMPDQPHAPTNPDLILQAMIEVNTWLKKAL
jgi:dipeptidyl aminopeptidase/acylaminoacyl peptidase